jgi:hypothetical protein
MDVELLIPVAHYRFVLLYYFVRYLLYNTSSPLSQSKSGFLFRTQFLIVYIICIF